MQSDVISVTLHFILLEYISATRYIVVRIYHPHLHMEQGWGSSISRGEKVKQWIKSPEPFRAMYVYTLKHKHKFPLNIKRD